MALLVHWLARGLLLTTILFGPTVHAQPAPQELRVVTRILPPMVIDQQGQLSGFSIELWNTISERLNAKTAYQTAPNVGALLGGDTVRQSGGRHFCHFHHVRSGTRIRLFTAHDERWPANHGAGPRRGCGIQSADGLARSAVLQSHPCLAWNCTTADLDPCSSGLVA